MIVASDSSRSLSGSAQPEDDLEFLVGVGVDISERWKSEREKEVLIRKLEGILSEVK